MTILSTCKHSVENFVLCAASNKKKKYNKLRPTDSFFIQPLASCSSKPVQFALKGIINTNLINKIKHDTIE